MRHQWAVGGIDGFDLLNFGLQQAADNFAKPVAAVAHRQQLQGIFWPDAVPAASDGFAGGKSGERALKLVRDDQNFHGLVRWPGLMTGAFQTPPIAPPAVQSFLR